MYGLFTYLDSNSGVAISKTTIWLFAFLQIVTCAVLWFFPATIAKKLLPSATDTDLPRSPVALIEWQTLGVICIGIWALTRAIPDAIYWMTFYSMSESVDYSFSILNAEQKASIITTVAELAIGLWLVFGAKGFAAF